MYYPYVFKLMYLNSLLIHEDKVSWIKFYDENINMVFHYSLRMLIG